MLKHTQLMLIRTLPNDVATFLSWVGKNPMDTNGFNGIGWFDKFLWAVRAGRKVGMTLPSYLDPLTPIEKQTVMLAYDTFDDPEKLEKYMNEVEDEELQRLRLLILKDRIENKLLT